MRKIRQGKRCAFKRNIEACPRNMPRAFLWVALVTRHALRMRHIILSSVNCPFLPYCSILSHKQSDFREKVIEPKICVWFSMQHSLETFLIIRRIQRDIIITRFRALGKVLVIRVRL